MIIFAKKDLPIEKKSVMIITVRRIEKMENKNGQGIFLGVVGVATLIVAIIGATFAYFSAATTAGDGVIQGQTLGGTEGGVLNLAVSKISWDDAGATSNDLVPTDITTATAQTAITAKCVASPSSSDTTKYTGCHLYRIVATAGSDVASANLDLTAFTLTGVTDAAKWHYAVWSTTDAYNATTYTLGTNVDTATGTGAVAAPTTKSIFANTAMTAVTATDMTNAKVYYLLVYVENTDQIQNTEGTNSVVGSYTGELTLAAAGGSRVQATFSA